MMLRVVKWLMLVIVALGVLAVLAYGLYVKRDLVSVWLDQAEPRMELSATPLFHPMKRFVISLEGGEQSRYLVLELALVTHSPDQLAMMPDLMPLIRNAMVQYFSHRTHDEVKKELQDITALQTALLAKLVTTLQGYGYRTSLDELLITKVLVQ